MRNKTIILALLLISTALAISLYFIYKIPKQQGFVEIETVPLETTYRIKGKKYTGNNVLQIPSGRYSVTFTNELFENKKETIEVRPNETIKYIIILVEKNKKSTTLKEDDVLESAANIRGDIDAENFLKNNPLINYLPYETDNFSILNTVNENGATVYQVSLYLRGDSTQEKLKNEAIRWIESKGVNHENIEIIYSVYDNRSSFNDE